MGDILREKVGGNGILRIRGFSEWYIARYRVRAIPINQAFRFSLNSLYSPHPLELYIV